MMYILSRLKIVGLNGVSTNQARLKIVRSIRHD